MSRPRECGLRSRSSHINYPVQPDRLKLEFFPPRRPLTPPPPPILPSRRALLHGLHLLGLLLLRAHHQDGSPGLQQWVLSLCYFPAAVQQDSCLTHSLASLLLLPTVNLSVSVVIGVLGGVTLVTSWWRFGSVMACVVVVGLVLGFMVASTVLFTPLGRWEETRRPVRPRLYTHTRTHAQRPVFVCFS